MGLLDAHEDVGSLLVLPDRLRFLSSRDVQLLKSEVRRVRFRINPTVSASVDGSAWRGESEGVPVRLQVEPRERHTLLGTLPSAEP